MIVDFISNIIVERLNDGGKPIFVSICGWADVGKSTLAGNISIELSRRGIKSNCISTDSFMKNREVRNQIGISGYNPLSLRIKSLLDAIRAFTDQRDFEYFPYHNRLGENSKKGKLMEPAEVYIIEGIHSFNPAIEENVRLKIFIDSDLSTLRRLRYLANINKRGFDELNAGNKIPSELREFFEFIVPYKKNAHINIVVDENYQYTLQ